MIKKILLISTFFVVGTAFSQTFQLLDHNDVNIENTSHLEYDDKDALNVTKFHVKNLTNSMQSFSVKVEKVYAPYTNSDLQVCFGANCYSGLATVTGVQLINSGVGDNIAANGTYTDLKIAPVTWMWNSFPNDSAVWLLTIYKTSNSNDVSSATVTWRSDGTVSVRELNTKKIELSAFPNPAVDKLTIQYDLKENTGNTVLEVYDILGKNISSRVLNSVKGSVDLNFEKINSGVYFYSIKVSGQVLKTEKFIVK